MESQQSDGSVPPPLQHAESMRSQRRALCTPPVLETSNRAAGDMSARQSWRCFFRFPVVNCTLHTSAFGGIVHSKHFVWAQTEPCAGNSISLPLTRHSPQRKQSSRPRLSGGPLFSSYRYCASMILAVLQERLILPFKPFCWGIFLGRRSILFSLASLSIALTSVRFCSNADQSTITARLFEH